MTKLYSLFFTFIFLINTYADEYHEKIQPIFNNRCIACHSCFNGPCQLNLQNYEGFERGANRVNVYNGTRLNSTHPTRLGIDATTVDGWRKLNFYNINSSTELYNSLFYQSLRTELLSQRTLPSKTVEESTSCIDQVDILKQVLKQSDDLKMPYALSPLSEKDRETLGEWIKKGAKGPTEKFKIPSHLKPLIEEWENFLNTNHQKNKLVSRYLYEHLFLAHIYFNESPRTFFRIVRSKTACEKRIEEIATVRPNDYPGTNDFFYCLKPYDATIVAKTHMPFLFSKEILEKTKNLFFSKKWDVPANQKQEETYSNQIAENPFIAFKDIPADIRYKFLLENAYYMVSTFIKGPVCNGSNALNSIQEQFYVLFLKPESGFLTSADGASDKYNDLLIMPGIWGSDVKLTDSISFTRTLIKKREEYRRKKAEWLEKEMPKGYSYQDLWDGDGHNNNALLTVFRHDDNAVVAKGLKGDLSKTVFVLDYSLFERLVYNLVVNFDVFGNLGHQTLTRIYMDYIRMEAEENFLLFMPPATRLPIRQSWYQGMFTNLKMSYMFPLLIKKHPTAIIYKDPTIANAKTEFIQTVLANTQRNVKGSDDLMNWKTISPSEGSMNANDKLISEMAGVKVKGRMRFPNFFPETSYLIVRKKDKSIDVYSVIKNREHANISWILNESLRLAPKEDSLTIEKGFYNFYPNYFFEVNEEDLGTFKDKVLKISVLQNYQDFKALYGVSRVSDKFWAIYDELTEKFHKEDPIEAGYLDLTRYLME